MRREHSGAARPAGGTLDDCVELREGPNPAAAAFAFPELAAASHVR